jgi:uncharacterized protein YbjT (DUF2867 family)
MLITVFGAGGQTGQLVVAELLEKGHSVRAFLRDPSKLAISDSRLELVTGDARDAAAVDAAVQGADAVISTLGASRKDKEPVFAAGTKNIIAAMRAHDCRPISVLSAQGAGTESDSELSFMLRVLRRLLRDTIVNMREMEEALKTCDLDWTIIRPGGMNNEPLGRYDIVEANAIRGGGRTRRADLADALVLAVTEHKWPRQAVSIASR